MYTASWEVKNWHNFSTYWHKILSYRHTHKVKKDLTFFFTNDEAGEKETNDVPHSGQNNFERTISLLFFIFEIK